MLKLLIDHQGQDSKLFSQFLFKQLIFYPKPTNKIWNFGPLACSKKFNHFWESWIGNHNSDFAETFHSPSLSRQETDVSIFLSINLSFRQNQLMKFKISTFSPAQTNFTTKISYLLDWFYLKDKFTEQQIDTASSCLDSKELWKVSAKN